LRVAVTDTGIGINVNDQERIFKEFEQVDSTHGRQQQGTGLGLALARKLAEMHGGRVWVESEGIEGKGSTFTFLIPILKAEDQPAQNVGTPHSQDDNILPSFNEAVRTGASLRNAIYAKHLYDKLQIERENSEQLLLSILPKPIAERMKKGEINIADSHPDVTVLVADLVGFTTLSAHINPEMVVHLLNEVFSAFDILVEKKWPGKDQNFRRRLYGRRQYLHPSARPCRSLRRTGARSSERD
jgi:hypothetical protein